MLKKPFFYTLIATLFLQACAPIMVAGTAEGVSAAYDQRTLSTIYQDEGIAHQAYGLLYDDPMLKDTHLNIVSINSVVLVVGQTATAEQKKKISDVIQSIAEVKKTYNQVTIGPTTPPLTKSNDIWITTKVKAAMLTENGLPSTQVRVLTEDGVVYLLGVVDKTQAELAVSVASKIKGVKKVVKFFQPKAEKTQTNQEK
jgi:osmotically-inducible protein OsmY